MAFLSELLWFHEKYRIRVDCNPVKNTCYKYQLHLNAYIPFLQHKPWTFGFMDISITTSQWLPITITLALTIAAIVGTSLSLSLSNYAFFFSSYTFKFTIFLLNFLDYKQFIVYWGRNRKPWNQKFESWKYLLNLLLIKLPLNVKVALELNRWSYACGI